MFRPQQAFSSPITYPSPLYFLPMDPLNSPPSSFAQSHTHGPWTHQAHINFYLHPSSIKEHLDSSLPWKEKNLRKKSVLHITQTKAPLPPLSLGFFDFSAFLGAHTFIDLHIIRVCFSLIFEDMDLKEADLSAPHSMGTTIIGVTYNGGVVLGADSRTSTGIFAFLLFLFGYREINFFLSFSEKQNLA